MCIVLIKMSYLYDNLKETKTLHLLYRDMKNRY